MRRILEKQRWISLVMAVLTTVVGFFLITSGVDDRSASIALLRAFNTWSWLLAILGFGSRYLNFTDTRMKYANEAELPFYILHQPVILILGYYVVQWNASILTKYLLIAASSFVVIMMLYELLVRRIKPLRFLFGMK